MESFVDNFVLVSCILVIHLLRVVTVVCYMTRISVFYGVTCIWVQVSDLSSAAIQSRLRLVA